MIQLLAGEKQKGESSKAMQACNDYLRMGPGRSLRELNRLYGASEEHQNTAPTRSLDTLFAWSTRYGWQKRTEQYDAELERQKTERAKEIMQSGLALSHKRVEKLKQLAALLWEELMTEDKRWLPDVKQIGAGKSAERVDIVRFNSALVSEYRATLDDIAKEMGDRKGGADVEVNIFDLEEWKCKRKERLEGVVKAISKDNDRKFA